MNKQTKQPNINPSLDPSCSLWVNAVFIEWQRGRGTDSSGEVGLGEVRGIYPSGTDRNSRINRGRWRKAVC